MFLWVSSLFRNESLKSVTYRRSKTLKHFLFLCSSLQVQTLTLRTRECLLLYIAQLPHEMKYVPIFKTQKQYWKEKWVTTQSYCFFILTEGCGAAAQAQSRGQCARQILAYTFTHGSRKLGQKLRCSPDTTCLQPGCDRQVRKDTAASCGAQWPWRGNL